MEPLRDGDCARPSRHRAAGDGLRRNEQQRQDGVISRDDGREQVTYNGLPLYYFANDKAPGDTKGQGVGGVWFVAAP